MSALRILQETLQRGDYPPLLDRIDTSALQQGETPTRALVVFNRSDAPATGVVVYRAAFSIRAAAGPQPVTVRESAGAVIPSRVVNETVRPHETLPARLWWEFDLKMFVRGIPPFGWRAYAATYECSDEATFPDACPPHQALIVAETDCHDGDLPATFSLRDL